MLKRFVALSLVLSLLTLPAFAQNGSGELLTRIRAEAMDRSQIMKTMHMLTDLYGPRLARSPDARPRCGPPLNRVPGRRLALVVLRPCFHSSGMDRYGRLRSSTWHAYSRATRSLMRQTL